MGAIELEHVTKEFAGGVVAAYPVVVPGARSRDVRLPRGAWFRINAGEELDGPISRVRERGLSRTTR